MVFSSSSSNQHSKLPQYDGSAMGGAIAHAGGWLSADQYGS
jgi:hypothetical protein